jgi:anti-anti-sigma factor
VTVDTDEVPGAAVVRIQGDLDLAGVPAVERALAEAKAQATTLVIDLGRVSFIDSAGMRCLLHAGTEAHRNGHRLSVRRGPSAVQRVFELTRADRILDFID